MSSAQEDVGVNDEGQPLPQEIDGDLITKMRECLAVTRRKILVEVKAQRLADSHGIFGWEVVKEYEAPELAEDEEDAKLIKEALARAKKVKKVSNRGNNAHKENLRGFNFAESEIVQPVLQPWVPAVQQPQLFQNEKFSPFFKKKETLVSKNCKLLDVLSHCLTIYVFY